MDGKIKKEAIVLNVILIEIFYLDKMNSLEKKYFIKKFKN